LEVSFCAPIVLTRMKEASMKTLMLQSCRNSIILTFPVKSCKEGVLLDMLNTKLISSESFCRVIFQKLCNQILQSSAKMWRYIYKLVAFQNFPRSARLVGCIERCTPISQFEKKNAQAPVIYCPVMACSSNDFWSCKASRGIRYVMSELT
jgi:hypothetical protein